MPLKQCCKLEEKKAKLELVTKFLIVVSEPNRLNILRILRNRELSVAEIWQFLDLPQSLVSHHLKVMKEFGLLISRKDGKQVIYKLKKELLSRYKSLLIKFI